MNFTPKEEMDFHRAYHEVNEPRCFYCRETCKVCRSRLAVAGVYCRECLNAETAGFSREDLEAVDRIDKLVEAGVDYGAISEAGMLID